MTEQRFKKEETSKTKLIKVSFHLKYKINLTSVTKPFGKTIDLFFLSRILKALSPYSDYIFLYVVTF